MLCFGDMSFVWRCFRFAFVVVCIVALHSNSAMAEFLENKYDALFEDTPYESSVNNQLSPESIDRYANIVIGLNQVDVVKYLENIGDQNTITTSIKDINNLFENINQTQDATGETQNWIKKLISNITDKFQSSTDNQTTQTQQIQINSVPGGVIQAIIPGMDEQKTNDTGGGSNGGSGTNTSDTSGSSDNGGNTGGGSSGGEQNQPQPITCKGMAEEQIKSRLAQLDALINASPQSITLLYERGMMFFCLGDFKKSGLELAKMNSIDKDATQALLNDLDNNLVMDRFSKVLDTYKSSPLNPDIMTNAQKIQSALENQNQTSEQYVDQLNAGYKYTPPANQQIDYIAEVDKLYKVYTSQDPAQAQDLLSKDLSAIYGSDTAQDIIKSKTETTGSGTILQP